MTKEEAIARASEWVRAQYPVVPPMGLATRLTLPEGVEVSPAETKELQAVACKWMVSFCCSWDTDALGFPLQLHVLV
jgi:hypothetical protein